MAANPAEQFKDFKPKQEVLDLLPDITGNEINGLGESASRNPKPIMWHDPGIIPHAEVQKYFSRQGNAHKDISQFSAGTGTGQIELPEIAAERPDWTPEEWTAKVKEASLARDADLVGICRLDQSWVFEGFKADYEWMVILAVEMDYDNLSHAPGVKSQNEVKLQYRRGTEAAYKLAGWMHEQGWDAKPHGGPQSGPVLMIPGAIQAGLGELGKHGSMINRQYGSSFRLANVLTNIPLIPDAPDEFGSDDFCMNCQLCTNVCPVDAIQPEKQLVRGEQKWYVDFDKCILFFVENNGCAMCLPACPWSRPGVAPRLAEKMSRRNG